jgi:hypothetical protein
MKMTNEISTHLQKHIVYPASKREIVEACNNMTDVPQEDKTYFENYLPDWNYRNAGEVIRGVKVAEALEKVTYPTWKKDLIKAFSKMEDIPKDYREWSDRNLPDLSYNSRDDVLGMLKGSIHIREHVIYPANKVTILETCNKMNEVPEIERDRFERCLPERLYDNADAAIKSCQM